MTYPDHPVLLRIDASARAEGSHSRQLADWAQARWLAAHPQGRVQTRDLASDPIGHLQAATIDGFYTPPDRMTDAVRAVVAQSDELIAELEAAHTVLISAPMYNFSVPSSLKAWIDQVVRIDRTFTFDGERFEGLVKGPRAVLALAYGTGGYANGPMAAFDHLQPYLVSLLNFIGITDVRSVTAEDTTADAGTVARALASARLQAEALFAPAAHSA